MSGISGVFREEKTLIEGANSDTNFPKKPVEFLNV